MVVEGRRGELDGPVPVPVLAGGNIRQFTLLP